MKKTLLFLIMSILILSSCATSGKYARYYNMHPGKAKYKLPKCGLFPKPLFKE
jgi:hypothetical protein